MKSNRSAGNNARRGPRKLIYVKSAAEVPDFKSDDEIAAWYQTHSTVLIQDQLETLPAKVGGKLRSRFMSRRGGKRRTRKPRHPSRAAS